MSNLYSRIGIGTANWGQEYNHFKVVKAEQKRILDWCQQVGIDLIDTAMAYKPNKTLIQNSYCKVVLKVRGQDYPYLSWEPWGFAQTMVHHVEEYDRFAGMTNSVSLNEPKDILHLLGKQLDIVQIPYSLWDRRFESMLPYLAKVSNEIHVRSVFLRGRILEARWWEDSRVTIPPEECLKFCLCNRWISKVIVGARSLWELQESLGFIEDWDDQEKTDPDIIDPRRWGEKVNG